MLDYIQLTNDNHFINNDVLYIKVNNNVYKYKIINYKEMKKEDKVYIYIYNDEYFKEAYAFYDEKIRDIFNILLSINSVGLKTAKILITQFSYEEFMTIIKEFNYNALTSIKGFGIVTAKTIIESLQKKLFDITYTPREEKMIQTVVRLGYPRDMVLKTIKTIDSKLKDEEYLKTLLTNLSKADPNYV